MLSTYIRHLYSALGRKRAYSTYNRDTSHAEVVATAGFQYAQKEIHLLSHNLDMDVYGNSVLIDAASRFLERPKSLLKVLVEEPISNNHPILSVMRDNEDKASLKLVPNKFQEFYECNFMLVDSFGYRYEPNRERCNATVVFYDEEKLSMVCTLRRLFNILYEASEGLES